MSHLSIDRVAIKHLLANLGQWGLFVDTAPQGFILRWHDSPNPIGKFQQFLKSTVPPYTKPPVGRDQGAHDSRRDMEVATSVLWSKVPETYQKHLGFVFHTESEANEALELVNRALAEDHSKREAINRMATEKLAFGTWVEIQDLRPWPQGLYVRSTVTLPTSQLQKAMSNETNLADDPGTWEHLQGATAKAWQRALVNSVGPQIEGDILSAVDRERGHLDTLNDTVYSVNRSRPPKWDLVRVNQHTTTIQVQILVSAD